MTDGEILQLRSDKAFSDLITFQVDKYWHGRKGYQKAFLALHHYRFSLVDLAWSKIATLPPGKPANFYTSCTRNLLIDLIRKGAATIRRRELRAARAFLKANPEYIWVRGARGKRLRRMKSLTPPDLKDRTMGRNQSSYLKGVDPRDVARQNRVMDMLGVVGFHIIKPDYLEEATEEANEETERMFREKKRLPPVP